MTGLATAGRATVSPATITPDGVLTRLDDVLRTALAPLLPDRLERWAAGHLLWPYLGAAVLLLALVALVLGAAWGLRGTRARAGEDALVSRRAARLKALPRYASLRRRRRAVGAVTLVLALLTVGSAGWVAARPGVVETRAGETVGRDLMLCLDASRSMWNDNALVLAAVDDVLDSLRPGDRVGLTLWSGSAIRVLPLTDDLTAVRDELARAQQAFAERRYAYLAGIDPPEWVASLIGDGLVSCADSFDRLDEHRSRAILLASDNDPLGQGAYTLPEAAAVAAADDIVVYGIGAASLDRAKNADARAELASATEATGGFLAVTGPAGSTGARRTAEIVAQVDALEASRSPGLVQHVRVDVPGAGRAVAPLAALALLAVVLVGALRRAWVRSR
ncbi:VWA domain-containing protein [Nocardioides sp. GY 10127]|uniref:vWA domain-containing protein n=1 Tax=Nocardioides sp. GY 10127 TaxID=2569762 RepID=UPI0010A794A8|nr:VWA domain-containing protein [Nocardioides sp. GY 10127]TIC78933.1 VWA domain-containing protein [Nocardioides sp. GY 10127]